MIRVRIRISLRFLFVVVALCCLVLGIRGYHRRRHAEATAKLQHARAQLYDGFEDPIGPNWLWTRKLPPNGVPSNSFFPHVVPLGDWFVRSPFCTTGYFKCCLEGSVFDRNHLRLLPRLYHLEHLTLIDTNIAFDREDILILSQMQSLRILEVKCDRMLPETLLNFAELRQLVYLSLVAPRITDQDLEVLRERLPNCRINR